MKLKASSLIILIFFLINKTVQIFFTINGELKVVMEPRKRVQCAEHCIYIYALDKFNIVEKEQRNLGILSEKKGGGKKGSLLLIQTIQMVNSKEE